MINLLRHLKLGLIGGLAAALLTAVLKISSLNNQIAQIKIEQAQSYSQYVTKVIDTERLIAEKTNEISKAFEQDKIEIKERADNTIRDLERDGFRLRQDIATIKLSNSTNKDASQSNDSARCELSREAEIFFIREAARADTNTQQLNRLIEAVEQQQSLNNKD